MDPHWFQAQDLQSTRLFNVLPSSHWILPTLSLIHVFICLFDGRSLSTHWARWLGHKDGRELVLALEGSQTWTLPGGVSTALMHYRRIPQPSDASPAAAQIHSSFS